MTTVSGVPSSNSYGYKAPATGSGNPSGTQTNAAAAASAANLSAVEGVLASFGSGSSLPLTYNAAGLLNFSQAAAPVVAGKALTGAQAAKDAVMAAENAVTDTLNSLLSNTSADSSNSSASDVSSLFSLPGTSNAKDPFSLLQNTLPNAQASTPASGSPAAQTAQNAVIAAQNAVTSTLASLEAGTSSNTSVSGG